MHHIPQGTTSPTERYFEIDLLRSLAILGMVIYHTAYDLEVFYGWPVLRSLGVGGWLLARSTAVLFLLLVGISFRISWERIHARRDPWPLGVWWPTHNVSRYWSKYFRRGFQIFLCGMLVTAATYVWDPSTYVRFGVLHLIGVSIVLLPIFTKLKEGNALLGLAFLVAGNALMGTTASTSLLLPMGIPPKHFATVDYFPLLPWFGVVLLGDALGHALYVRSLRWRSHLPSIHPPLITPTSRRSLVIYLVHQPILFLVLKILLGAPR
jgi:uncharacterized membrane protein